MAGLSENDRRAWLRLLGCPLDRNLLATLIQETPHPDALLEESNASLVRRFSLNERQLAQLRRTPPQSRIDKQLAAMDAHRIQIVTPGSEAYPANLFRMRTPPPVIFVKGKIESFDTLAVGIVGPRMPTPYGVEVARKFARDFAPSLTVASGAAMGIDSAAHQATLDAGGRTIAVLGCGIDVDYPASNRLLRKRIGEEGNGALVSIFPPGERPRPQNFPIRNFILAGLSLAVIIVEAGEKSGALVTARAAGEEGRMVYAVPGDITRRNSRGSNALLRDGAAVCASADDVLADLESTLQNELEELRRRRLAAPEASPGEEENPPPSASPAESILLRDIQHHPVSHDDLMARYVPGKLSVGDLAAALLTLEMQGRIRQEPGRIYSPAL